MPEVRSPIGVARFASARELALTEIAATPLIDCINDVTQQQILADSERILGHYRSLAGVEVPIAAHLVVARKD